MKQAACNLSLTAMTRVRVRIMTRIRKSAQSKSRQRDIKAVEARINTEPKKEFFHHYLIDFTTQKILQKTVLMIVSKKSHTVSANGNECYANIQ